MKKITNNFSIMEITINTEFFKGIEIQDLKDYIKELKEERESLRSKINTHIENTIFDDGKNRALNIEISKLSKEIVYLSTGLMLKINGRI